MIEPKHDQTLFHLIDPSELLGDDAQKICGIDLGHDLAFGSLTQPIVHFAVEEIVDFFLVEQVDGLVEEEVAQFFFALQFGEVVEFGSVVWIGVELLFEPVDLFRARVCVVFEGVGVEEDHFAYLPQHYYNYGKSIALFRKRRKEDKL